MDAKTAVKILRNGGNDMMEFVYDNNEQIADLIEQLEKEAAIGRSLIKYTNFFPEISFSGCDDDCWNCLLCDYCELNNMPEK